MKNTLIRIISVLLMLALLSGCGAEAPAAEETAVAYVFEYKPESVPVEMLSFEDSEYVRPDIEGMHALAAQLEEALQLERNHEQVCSLIDKFKAQCTDFETMYAVANIRACKDVTDEYYDKEYSYCMAADAEVALLVEEVYSLCAESAYAEWLEANLLWDGFVEESSVDDFAQAQDNSNKYLKLAEREAELEAFDIEGNIAVLHMRNSASVKAAEQENQEALETMLEAEELTARDRYELQRAFEEAEVPQKYDLQVLVDYEKPTFTYNPDTIEHVIHAFNAAFNQYVETGDFTVVEPYVLSDLLEEALQKEEARLPINDLDVSEIVLSGFEWQVKGATKDFDISYGVNLVDGTYYITHIHIEQ